jgi:Tol biopolymer transport system component
MNTRLGYAGAAAACIALAATTTAMHQLKSLHDPRETHLANIRQLTFGGQNAECYWSFSGKKLIFQAHNDQTKADQIFTMNPDGSGVKMVSTGTGRTTCAYFLKGDKEIIFASTHGYSPDVPSEPDRSKGYVWPVYPSYAIYRANADGSNLHPIFPKEVKPGVETGYNAEATVSPDGKRIIFTSDRSGDLELYTMKPDGTDVKQITHTLGYDGGAFFSPDGTKIVWRAGRPETQAEKDEYLSLLKQHIVRPTRMELYIADADGSNARQLTSNGAANFAPFFTPDGKSILFSSNLGDPMRRKFEIYRISVAGGEPERITYGDQFDGFPMFSPNGKKLVFASNRNGKVPRETNVFIADWIP